MFSFCLFVFKQLKLIDIYSLDISMVQKIAIISLNPGNVDCKPASVMGNSEGDKRCVEYGR